MFVNREHPLRPSRTGAIVTLLLLLILAAITVLPMYWMVLNAIQPESLSIQFPPSFWPSSVTFQHFERLFSRPYFFQWTLNSLIYASAVTVLTLVTASLAGYAYAKLRFPGSKLLFWMYVISMMLPFHTTLIPLFIILTRLGWTDTYAGLILPAVASPFAVFLMKQFIQTLPSELLDSARLDGCSEFQVWRHVVLPLSKPGLAFLGIITFVAHWNDFLWPLVITSSPDMRTLQVGLVLMREEEPLSFALQMAGATYAAIPMILVFFIFQRYFLQGGTVGAMKG